MRDHKVSDNGKQEPDDKKGVEGSNADWLQVDRCRWPALIPNVYIILVVVEGCKMEILFHFIVQVDLESWDKGKTG